MRCKNNITLFRFLLPKLCNVGHVARCGLFKLWTFCIYHENEVRRDVIAWRLSKSVAVAAVSANMSNAAALTQSVSWKILFTSRPRRASFLSGRRVQRPAEKQRTRVRFDVFWRSPHMCAWLLLPIFLVASFFRIVLNSGAGKHGRGKSQAS